MAEAEELRLPYARLKDADFSGRRLSTIDIGSGSRLVRCDFSRIRVASGSLGGGVEPSEYVECSFDGAHLKNVMPGRATFVRCSFQNVKIYNARCLSAEFIDCVFSGLLRGVIFDAVPWDNDRLGRSRNEYRGNDFSGARLENVAFRGGIDLNLQWFPDSPDYVLIRDAATTIERAWDEIDTWPDDLRKVVESGLSVLADTSRRGQRDLFVEKSFILRSVQERNPESAQRLIALLTQE